MRKIVLFFTVILLLLCNMVVYGQERGCAGFNSAIEHQNINCKYYWENEKNGVVKIINDQGCWTGTLLNTTLGENNPHHYILTRKSSLPNGNTYDLNNWEFYWHYESWQCKVYTEPPHIMKTGAELGAKVVAKDFHGDFALIELDVDPAEEWDITPYYLGWDHSGSIVTGATLIYHPNGDIKKIYYPDRTTESALMSYQGGCSVYVEHLYTHWALPYWSPTTFHNGSDGSGGAPFLNSDRRFIGHYCYPGRCTSQGCENAFIFGKFSYAWEGYRNDYYGCYPDETCRLKDWLDPLNTGQETLDGRDCQQTIRLEKRQPRATETYHAVQTIISKKGFDPKFNVTYKAGESIVLKPGFHAKRGSIFHAQIEELICDNAPSLSFAHQGDESHNDIVNAPDFSLPLLKTSPKVNIVPNPNNGSFNIETNFPLSDIAHFKITNLMGATVYETQNVVSNTVQLPRPTAGTFFVVMILKNGAVLTQKMVVQ